MSETNARVLVFTATYNELENVAAFCQRVLANPGVSSLLIVDDSSPDGTADRIRDLARQDERIRLIQRSKKLGLGSAHKLAMSYAIKQGFDRLVTMDADLSHRPEDIPALLKAAETHDFVIGSRYAKGGECGYSGYRLFISVLANRSSRIALGIQLTEFTSSFRVFNVPSLLTNLDVDEIRSQGYSFFLQTVDQIARQRFSYAEVPIRFSDRLKGVSKIPRFEIVWGFLTLFRLTLRRILGPL